MLLSTDSISVICCLEQDMTITTQVEMDVFDPNTTVINGFLYIDGYSSNSISDPITNLDNLSNLTFIGRYLKIHKNVALRNLDGLANLTSIGEYGEYLYIGGNNALTNVNGLSNLTSIDGYIYRIILL